MAKLSETGRIEDILDYEDRQRSHQDVCNWFNNVIRIEILLSNPQCRSYLTKLKETCENIPKLTLWII